MTAPVLWIGVGFRVNPHAAAPLFFSLLLFPASILLSSFFFP
jgi:hypothetical protein